MTDRDVTLSEEPSVTSSTLLRQAAARDEASWQVLVDRYGPFVYRHCRLQGLQPANAADIVQEVFIAVARNLERYRHDRPDDSFRGWLLTIAWNKIRDGARASKKSPQALGGSGGFLDGAAALASNDASSTSQLRSLPAHLEIIHEVIERVRTEFPTEKWAYFCAVVIDDCDPTEVAAAAGTTLNVVYLAKSRILARLRRELTAVNEAR